MDIHSVPGVQSDVSNRNTLYVAEQFQLYLTVTIRRIVSEQNC